MTLKDVLIKTEYDDDMNLKYEGKIISLFYFRAGYVDKDFTDEVIKII